MNIVDSSFRDGRTPLHKAASNGHDEVMVTSIIITYILRYYLLTRRSCCYSMVPIKPYSTKMARHPKMCTRVISSQM